MKVLTLLTDFGSEDGFVGAMKGRILSRDPEIRIIDISHTIPKYDIKSASFSISNFVDFYPDDCVHLSVIDPGVGGNRKPLIVKTENFFLVTPDNGTASLVIDNYPCKIYEIKTDWIHWPISNTFHGRDIFAPAAAELVCGTAVEEIGELYTGEVINFASKAQQKGDKKWELKVLHVDHFGNIITNLRKDQLGENSDLRNARIQIGRTFLYGIKTHFSEVNKGQCLMLWGSSDYLEIAQNQGNANAFFHLSGKNKLFFEF